MVVEKKEKITLKKPVVKKTTSPKKTTTKKVEIKEISDNQVKVKEISDNQVKVIKQNTSKKTLDNLDRAYATGKRKNAIARVWLKKGNGKITINDQKPIDYLKRPILEVIINSPFVITETQDKFNVVCTVSGGGLSGQAGAIRHAISRALEIYNSEAYRKDLKSAGLLTRDSRVVERKKAGLKKARKGQVYRRR